MSPFVLCLPGRPSSWTPVAECGGGHTVILLALRDDFFPCNRITRVPFPLIKCEIQKPWSKLTVFHRVTLLVSIWASWLYQAMAQTWPGTFLPEEPCHFCVLIYQLKGTTARFEKQAGSYLSKGGISRPHGCTQAEERDLISVLLESIKSVS